TALSLPPVHAPIGSRSESCLLSFTSSKLQLRACSLRRYRACHMRVQLAKIRKPARLGKGERETLISIQNGRIEHLTLAGYGVRDIVLVRPLHRGTHLHCHLARGE